MTETLVDGLLAKIVKMSPGDKAALTEQMSPLIKKMRFIPLPGRQTEAYLSKADILLYGGQAGGGKTGLLVGLAQEHKHSIIFRRESSQTDGLERFGKEVYGTKGFNGTEKEWDWGDRSLKLAGMKEPGDWAKNAGRERDFMGFDEAGEFLRVQIGSMRGWVRGPAGQRARIVLGSNPPRTSDGYWMTEWFAPWLDIHHPNRAEPGELRWAVMLEGPAGQYPHWVDGPDPVEINGEERFPLSFSFIPASLEDNPYRDTAEYRAFLDSLPEPLRSQLKYGDWTAGVQDELNQVIPTAWAKAAMNRWTERPRVPVMTAMGIDVAQGGTDQTVIAPRYDEWYAPLLAIPGAETPSGADVAGRVIARRRDKAKMVVDLGGGWGGDALKHLAENTEAGAAIGYMGVKQSSRRTRDQQIRFFNVRTEAYWRFREALDPDQTDALAPVQLPLDNELLADLTAPTFTTKGSAGNMVIIVESKESVVKRLGRSPDKGDAVVMAWHAGEKAISDIEVQNMRAGNVRRNVGRLPQVIMGRQAARRAAGR